VSQSDSLRKLKSECTRLAVDCMQLAGDVYSPAFQLQFLRMMKAWPIPVQTGKAPTTMTLAKRVQISKQETQFRDARTPMALVRQLKKLRQENTSLRRRLLMRTD
jgi:hypothetical protein